ncbi:MAG: hypothetical protein CMH32_07250 [Micavibrio sp.]|nr:hypothetical protein [Micavibrio sp.]HCK32469.1 hypothetical protein [Rhodospirillaceae bacterium]|tara:strand:- start:518 stop:1516 length:999 start_codon:yes stop_codon:yes gene_type:complete
MGLYQSVENGLTTTETFLQACKKPKADTTLHSLSYYMLTGRHDCHVYRDESALLVVCQHPHKKNHLLVFPEIGDGDGSLTCNVLRDLHNNGKQIQLARYTKDDFDLILRVLDPSRSDLIESLEIFREDSLDWTYPVHILSTEAMSKREGKAFQNLRSACNRVEKDFDTVSAIDLAHPDAQKYMKYVQKLWEAQMIFMDKETMDISSYYNELFNLTQLAPEKYTGLIFIADDQPVGYTIAEIVSPKDAVGLANICDTRIKKMAAYQAAKLCEHLNEQGIEKLNIGGSETKGLNDSKISNYRPSESIELLSARVRYKTDKPLFAKHQLSSPSFV